jgi:hypothetical protein
MHRNVVTVLIVAFAVALAGAVLGLAASAGASTSRSTATTTAFRARVGRTARSTVSDAAAKRLRYVVLDCGQRQVRPGRYVLACADDGIGLQGLHWTSWTAELASGYGTLYENDCTPNCADGHVHHYRALATLWGSATVPGHPGDRRYTRLTVIFPGKHRPPVHHLKKGKLVATYPLTQTFDTY